jgi:hypothetical protein
MGFNIKPKLETYVAYPLSKGWGVMNQKTGELLKKEGYQHRIERYGCKAWAVHRCKELNETEDKPCKDT